MADVDGNLKDWSTTAASNKPSGATTIGTGLDDNLREIEKVVRTDLASKGADIASAGTMDIGAIPGLYHDITGTTTVTGLGTVSAGIWKKLKFEGAVPLIHNATSLILPSAANITTADGDTAEFISEGSGNWRCLDYQKANGTPVSGLTLGTEQASTSGTSIDFTSIPSWAKRIVVQFVGVSTNGTSNWLIQLGDAGGVETTGYLGAGQEGGTATNYTAGFGLPIGTAAAVVHGAVTITLEDSANFTWVASGTLARSDSGAVYGLAGSKSTSASLDRVRITTDGGTDTFDAGAINILYS